MNKIRWIACFFALALVLLCMPRSADAASVRVRINGIPEGAAKVMVYFSDEKKLSCSKLRGGAWQSPRCGYSWDEISGVSFLTENGCSVNLGGSMFAAADALKGTIPVKVTLPKEVPYTILHEYYAVPGKGEPAKIGEVRILAVGYEGGTVDVKAIERLPVYAGRNYDYAGEDVPEILSLGNENALVNFRYARNIGDTVAYEIVHEYYADEAFQKCEGEKRVPCTGKIGDTIDVSAIAPVETYQRRPYTRISTEPAEDVRLNAGHDCVLVVAVRYCRTANLSAPTAKPVDAAPIIGTPAVSAVPSPTPMPSLNALEPNKNLNAAPEEKRSLGAAGLIALFLILAALTALTAFTIKWAARRRGHDDE